MERKKLSDVKDVKTGTSGKSIEEILNGTKHRIIPVLQKKSFAFPTLEDKLYFKDGLEEDLVEIDGSFRDDDRRTSWMGDSMEIFSKKISSKEVDGWGGRKEELNTYDVRLRFVPHHGYFKYSEKTSKAFGSTKYAVRPHSTEVQFDIVKYTKTLLFPYLYAMYHSEKTLASVWRNTVDKQLASAGGVAFSSIELEDDVVQYPKFLEWFKTVGQSLLEAYWEEPGEGINDILAGNAYLVYGEFDPTTRVNFREDEEKADEDDD